METLFNFSAIKNKMKDKPIGQRLYHFFSGATSMLTKEQIEDMKKIVEDNHEQTIKYLNDAISKVC